LEPASDTRIGKPGCAGTAQADGPLARKSVAPMAAHLAPQATRSRHQSLHHFVADSPWSHERHVPSSSTTSLRLRIAAALMQTLVQCPCCLHVNAR